MSRVDLDSETRKFAARINGVLNRTVCSGVRVSAVTSRDRTMAWIGYEISRDDVSPQRAVPMCLGDEATTAFLHIAYTLALDDQGAYLTVVDSVLAMCTSEDPDSSVFHYDYIRTPPEHYPYPPSHVQVKIENPAWNTISEDGARNADFGRLHLPLGPRRFRPTIEDLVEFVIIEKVARAHDGWQEALAEGREDFAKRQLRAAIRADLETAQEAVNEFSTSA